MTRAMLRFALPLLVLLTLLAALSAMQPEEAEPAPLSVLLLRSGEGNAVLVTCGGQTLLFPLGDAEDEADLERYLQRNRLIRVAKTVHLVPNRREEQRLADATCTYHLRADGALALSMRHGDNSFSLVFPPDARPELQCGREQPESLPTDRHSVRVLSDGVRLTVRPDFSAWAE